MHYLVLLGIGVASWRLTSDGTWNPFWYGFIALLLAGCIVQINDCRRRRAAQEAAYQKRKANRDA